MKISVLRQGTRARPVTVETVTRWSASMLRAMG
jgi:hypothetical protein